MSHLLSEMAGPRINIQEGVENLFGDVLSGVGWK